MIEGEMRTLRQLVFALLGVIMTVGGGGWYLISENGKLLATVVEGVSHLQENQQKLEEGRRKLSGHLHATETRVQEQVRAVREELHQFRLETVRNFGQLRGDLQAVKKDMGVLKQNVGVLKNADKQDLQVLGSEIRQDLQVPGGSK